MNTTWGYFNPSIYFFYYPLVLNLLVQFKFKVTYKKPIIKIQENLFYKHLQTIASILKTVWSKRQPPGVFCKKKGALGNFRNFRKKAPVLGSLLIKLLALGPESLLMRDSGTKLLLKIDSTLLA